MNKKIFFTLFLAISVLGLWTCKKDSKTDTCSGAWASELSSQINAMSDALTAYASNPTPATCNAYKQATQNYLDALAPYGNCATLTGQNRADWQAALDAAQASVDALDCSAAVQ
jgi:hypothetical protein